MSALTTFSQSRGSTPSAGALGPPRVGAAAGRGDCVCGAGDGGLDRPGAA
ncbi:MAG: hypothetical protein RLO54_01500 [Sandaracinaceae bacterium]